ncbi:peptidoglycan DD-metalloendopeptidase family protein [Pseudoalteromonas luteoviolacea]|uniref:LysM domain-containing protein n=1 Tax=Pseudoalteromonas luteoviolacea S4060-1 TaxID=1365257 RepID=A0A167PBF1_9GAMM|nr:peptidoglycan DD-metalloendopeptidase family protein [Pseudoalteromonas luteoviolacea]KZN70069.1 hypothetical protein N478_09655 [Pseudoalteromonas luteoviolacea S4060-1]
MKRHQIFYAACIVVGVSCTPIKEPTSQQPVSKPPPSDVKEAEVLAVQPSVELLIESEPKTATEIVTIEAGQSLMEILRVYNLSPRQVITLVSATQSWLDLNSITAGTRLQLMLDHQRQVTAVMLQVGFAKMLVARLSKEKWHVSELNMATEQVIRYAKVEVGNSLFNNALAADIPAGIINKLILVMSHRIDFQRALHKYDELEVLYDADVLSAQSLIGLQSMPRALRYVGLSVAGKRQVLYLHKDENDKSAYYFADGRVAQSFLLKTPLNGARLSSTFGKRKHPILGFTRIHKGLDFGAPVGTPIFAAGDGTVLKANWGGSFGNRVLIQHQHGYRTLYAHLQRFAKGIKAGVQVKQGQVIGFLGNTGMSQARHLHYEVHKDGRAINPLHLDSNQVSHNKMTEQQLAQLTRTIAEIDARLSIARSEHFDPPQKIALVEK